MNIEFHYYAIHYLCRAAGAGEAESETIARSSQTIDEATTLRIAVSGQGEWRIEPTQNYVFWDPSVQREIYQPYHFVPGLRMVADASRRIPCADDGVVTPDSPNAKHLLVDALRSGNAFRIGIALHAYADTWAHQQFSGIAGGTNVVDPASPLPPAGHLQALRAPDDPGTVWEDPRLLPEFRRVDNAGRFIAAARKIYRYLATWKHRTFVDEDFVLEPLESIWRSKSPAAGRDARISSYIVDLGVPPYERGRWEADAGFAGDAADTNPFRSGYDTRGWMKAAMHGGTIPAIVRTVDPDAFKSSPLYAWNEAARTHRDAAFGLYRPGAAS